MLDREQLVGMFGLRLQEFVETYPDQVSDALDFFEIALEVAKRPFDYQRFDDFLKKYEQYDEFGKSRFEEAFRLVRNFMVRRIER